MAVATTDPVAPEPFDAKKVQKLADTIVDGKCVLFLGAGVHRGPPPGSSFTYPEDVRPPLAKDLARRLADDCNFRTRCPGESDEDLKRVALCYEDEHGRRELVEQIKAAVETHKEPSPALKALAELPFPLVMTTNYDSLFEKALRAVKKDPQICVYNKVKYTPTRDYFGADEPTAEEPFVFKMHGDFDGPESLVVTDEDYITFVMRMRDLGALCPIPQTFTLPLQRSATLFVGYGLLDFNLRLLFRTMRWELDEVRIPKTYAVDVHPDELVKKWWTQRLGLDFIVEDVWQFVPRLYEAVLGKPLDASPQ